MKKLKIIYSIILSINIIIFFSEMSIYGIDCGYEFFEDKNNTKKEWELYWQQNKEFPTQMIISPGEDESILNFSWYSREKDGNSKLKIYTGSKEKHIHVKSSNLNTGFISNKAIVKNLKPNTTYFYSYTINGKWTEKIHIKTKNKDKFSFVFMGDPQIGASYKSKNLSSYEEGIKIDSYNWNKVLEVALNKKPSSSFILCAGDETNTKNDYSNIEKEEINKMEYCGYLSSEYLRHIPIVNIIGNHDESNIDFYYHFNQFNSSNLGTTRAGGDNYFIYNDVLFLLLNTNNLNVSEHKRFIEDVLQKNKNIKWRIAVFHHNIFGGGTHSNDKDIKFLRNELPTILEMNKISLVLNGHDHIYSRSYKLCQNKVVEDTVMKNGLEEIDNKNKGIIYITGGSCTGSKFYNKTYDNDKYVKIKFQEEVPTYTVIDINDEEITINSYRIDNNDKIDNTIKIKKITKLYKGLFYNKESFILFQ